MPRRAQTPPDAHSSEPAPSDARPCAADSQRWPSWLATALLVLAALAWLLAISDRAGAPYGDSDEGINGAVWSYNAESLRELGLVDSRLGGVRSDGTAYATHPPGIVLTTAAAQAIGGDGPWPDRSPAWIATLLAALLAYRLLRDLDVEPVPAAAATVAGFGCHMVLVYGYMLDTPVTSLPLGVAVVLAFNRRWQQRPFPPFAEAAIAAAAALSGWQAALTAGLAGVALALRSPRGRDSLPRATPYLAGTAVGAMASFGWALWAYGSLDELVDKYTLRTGGTGRVGASGEMEGVGLADVISFQVPWLAQLLGLGVVGLLLCALSIGDRRWRAPASLVLVTVVGYSLLFREAAAGHQYWLYWSLLAATLGFGFVAGPGLRRASADLSLSATGRVAVAVTLMAVVLAVNISRPDQAGELVDRGHLAAELVIAAEETADFPPDQESISHLGQPERPDAWILRETGREVETVRSVDELALLAEEHPDHLVLVMGGCSAANAKVCEALELRLLGDDGDPDSPRLTAAGELGELGER